MKNLSKIIFTSVAASLAAGAAHAAAAVVTSKAYVDSGLVQKANKTDVAGIKTITDSITTNDTIAKANAALQTADLAGYATTTALAGKADASTVYTKTESDARYDATGTAAAAVAAAASNYATATQGAKADATDTALTTNDTVAKANSALQTADLAGYATTTALAGKADASTVYTKTESDARYDATGTAAAAVAAAASSYATATQGAKADATDTALTTNDTIAKANSALQTADISGLETQLHASETYLAKADLTCPAGEMLYSAGGGTFTCISVERGTYTEE